MIKSVLIAAAVGAALLWSYEQVTGCPTCTQKTDGLLGGAIVGAGVQVILRMTGVS